MGHTYKYARPALTADSAVFALDDEGLKVLLIQRAQEPFQGQWALPGGFAEVGESLEDSARRELQEETGLTDIFLEQLCTFSKPDRDPREHVVTVAYYALINLADHEVHASTDASNVAWFGIDDVPRLAFDHDEILNTAIARLRSKIRCQPIGFELLPARFPLRALQNIYEKILGRNLDKRTFRKQITAMGILQELDEVETDADCSAARLYRFNKQEYDRKFEQGFTFEI